MKNFHINKLTNPKGLKKDQYDVIIIGAGIGGLVCGCYLAKAGLKVLIVEKNDKVGGYCTSFERDGYRFDACVHSLGSCREEGNIDKVIKDLGLKIKLLRANPSSIVITPDFKMEIKNDKYETIENFKKVFPHQSLEIEKFFKFILEENFIVLFLKLKNKTFKDLLDSYFNDEKLKCLLNIFLGSVGLPSSLLSAVTAFMLYREFIFDGGYYPEGGMQIFPSLVAKRFEELGGKILYTSKVDKIEVDKKIAKGVVLNNKDKIFARYIISNCDPWQTFLKFVGKKHLDKEFILKIKNSIPSISAFVVHLGLADNFEGLNYPVGLSLWYLQDYLNIERLFLDIFKGDIKASQKNILIFFSDNLFQENKKTLSILVNIPFKKKEFWIKYKNHQYNKMLEILNKILPNISSFIKVKTILTPYDLYKYTLNYKGAAYGLAALPNQIAKTAFSYHTPIENLFLVGHWTSQGNGVAMVAKSGVIVANSIMRRCGYK
ncbi:MAG: NAD(P)/FAD-dependent oxidoreductase [Candidatus Omnitrophica bacterium]|nr:NAD(P)/FAD-dependent oxidoreductase [Candidatus Omnitrophota bacterium]